MRNPIIYALGGALFATLAIFSWPHLMDNEPKGFSKEKLAELEAERVAFCTKHSTLTTGLCQK